MGEIVKAILFCLSLVIAVFQPTFVEAKDPQIVVLYDLGGKFDSSFNEAAHTGAELFKTRTGISYRDFEPTNEAQMQQAMKRYARKGYDLIIAIGVAYETPLRKIAAKYPDVRFVSIDSHVDLPNVQSIVFKEDEGSYLVGVLAAMASKTNTIGFIGGMDIPLIRKFARGYVQGAKSINPDIRIFQNMVGATPAAWSDPIRGGELARNQFARGADVIYAPAGPTSLGIIQAAKETGHYAIGVDSNQNHIAPGSVLTSMLKRVDQAVDRAMQAELDGTWHAGLEVLGVKEAGVDYALDEHNDALITAEMRARVEKARADIISGAIKIQP